MYDAEDELLFKLALKHRKDTKQVCNIKNWWGIRGGGTRRVYRCYVCDCVIDTESAKWRMTVHACERISQHKAYHVEKSGLIGFI
jgi:hypothetical protein